MNTPGGATTLGLSFAYLSVPTLNAVGPAEGPPRRRYDRDPHRRTPDRHEDRDVRRRTSHRRDRARRRHPDSPDTRALDGPPVDVVLDTPSGTATLTGAFTFVP